MSRLVLVPAAIVLAVTSVATVLLLAIRPAITPRPHVSRSSSPAHVRSKRHRVLRPRLDVDVPVATPPASETYRRRTSPSSSLPALDGTQAASPSPSPAPSPTCLVVIAGNCIP